MTPTQHDDEFISAAEVAGAKRAVVDGRTERVSPKVAWPAALGLLAGVLVFVAGIDDDLAVTLVLAALGYGGVGAVAPPGVVQEK